MDGNHYSEISVLLIEDNPADARLIMEALHQARNAVFVTDSVERLSVGVERLGNTAYDVILLDLTLPDSMGLDTLAKMREYAKMIPIIVLTGLNDEEMALEAMQGGAQDYLIKGEFAGNVLARAIRYAIERQKLVKQLQDAFAKIRTLSGLLPICSYCKKIRDDRGYWNQIETYIHKHSDADFSHSICPDCLKANYPDLYEEMKDELD